MVKYRALLIGCGNIGAVYDFENDFIQTHAKALYLDKKYDVFVYDHNIELATKVCEKYFFSLITDELAIDYTSFRLVSICTPTYTHFSFLKKCFQANVPLVICEKPVDLNLLNLKELKDLYKEGRTHILVNYIRRFQPNFIRLKEILSEQNQENKLQRISVNYTRGFFNNCSHAFDTIEFLLEKELHLTDFKLLSSNSDVFEDDPTLTLHAQWDEVSVLVSGIEYINYPVFEIYLYFRYVCISVLKSGNQLKVEYSKNISNTSLVFENSIENYMVPVIKYAEELSINETPLQDNFIRSIELVERMKSWINN